MVEQVDAVRSLLIVRGGETGVDFRGALHADRQRTADVLFQTGEQRDTVRQEPAPQFHRQAGFRGLEIRAGRHHVRQSLPAPVDHIQPGVKRLLRVARNPDVDFDRMPPAAGGLPRQMFHAAHEFGQEPAIRFSEAGLEIEGTAHPVQFEAVHFKAFEVFPDQCEMVIPYRFFSVVQTLGEPERILFLISGPPVFRVFPP